MPEKMLQFSKDGEEFETGDILPVLPLRDVVVFPYMVIPLMVGRPNSVAGIESAMLAERLILLVSQLDGENEEPSGKDLNRVGVIGRILQSVRLPDGTLKVLVEGLEKVHIRRYLPSLEYLRARFEVLPIDLGGGKELQALSRKAMCLFE